MGDLCLYLLGAPRLEQAGKPVDMDTRKAIALLAYLVVTKTAYTREAMATFLWPEYEASSARAALRRTLSVLRKGVGAGVLQTNWETISVLPGADVWVDVQQFLDGIKASRLDAASGQPPDLAILQEAAALYKDDFMAGFSLRDSASFNDWQFFQAEELRRKLTRALETLARGLAVRRDFPQAVAFARRWLTLDPLREEAHRQLMTLYSWMGERNSALRQYRECTRILDEELGVAPMEETTLLYQAILENQVSLPPQPAAAPPAPPLPTAAGFSSDPDQPAGLPVFPAEARPGEFIARLVGREEELAFLENTYSHNARDGALVALVGEPGIGKTRLADEFLAGVRAQGAVVLRGRCYEGEGSLAYAPFVEAIQGGLARPDLMEKLKQLPDAWVGEAARLVPGLDTAGWANSAQEYGEGAGAQSRFFEGLRHVIGGMSAGRKPGVLFLDDLHWADSASLELLQYLARRLPGTPLLILSTWRADEISAGHALQKLTYEVQRAGYGSVRVLRRLRPGDVIELVRGSGTAIAADDLERISERLLRETEGLPYFVVEYLKSLAQAGDASLANEWKIPHSVRDLLHARLAQVGEAGQQLLSTAAVIGRSFDFETLRDGSGRSEMETLAGLEQLLSQGLVVERAILDEPGAIRYDFSFDPLRSLVYEETSLTRRRLLHRRVADALVNQLHGQKGESPVAAQVANHSQAAGQERQAAEYFALAGEHAQRVFANQEALAHFRSALALGHPNPRRLHETIGDLLTLQGEYSGSLNSYQASAAQAVGVDLARLEHKLGEVYHRRGDWELAVQHYQNTLEILEEQGDPGQRAWVYADWSRTERQRQNQALATELAQKALELAGNSGEAPALAQAHNILGILARSQSLGEMAIYHFEQSLNVARKSNDLDLQAAALNNLALVYGECGDQQKAIELVRQALEICVRRGDRHHEAALQNHLADLYHNSGQPEKAMDHLTRAVMIYAEIGVDGGGFQPEIWKLTEW